MNFWEQKDVEFMRKMFFNHLQGCNKTGGLELTDKAIKFCSFLPEAKY